MRLYSVSVQTFSWLRWIVHCPTQLLIPLLNRILEEHFSCCSGSPITAGSSTAPQLHLLQLLLHNWICLAAGPQLHLLSCWSSIASASAAAPWFFSACDHAHAVVLKPYPSLHARKGLVKMYWRNLQLGTKKFIHYVHCVPSPNPSLSAANVVAWR